MAGYSTCGVFFVQSPVQDTRSRGRGAVHAPNSTLNASTRRFGAFSHRQPPCMCAEIMLTGAATFTRSSTAVSRNVCVPPPDSPVHPRRSGSTQGREAR